MNMLLRYRKPCWLALGALLVVLGLVYPLIVRPYHMRWGATDAELALALPGDAAIPDGSAVSTRAITIHAPTSTVWAWLVQTGQNRGGGWYSYTWLENLFAAEMGEAEQIDPRWQTIAVGDPLCFAAGGATNPAMAGTVSGVEPERSLWLGGWSFMLRPVDATTTRLVVRYPLERDILGTPALSYAIFEPAHFVMESGMLLGIKRRAERDPLLHDARMR